MSTIAQFLLSITGSIVARVLFALGFGVVSYAALTTLTADVVNSAFSSYQSITPAVLQILNLGGVGRALGIITSAMATRGALMAIKKLRPV